MKLRNKNTGEVVRFYDGITLNGEDYDSLAELNEEWEDYTPKEPLIKNEQIRKAVRYWAEIGKYEYVYYDKAYNRLADDYDFVHCIEFAIDPCPDAKSERCYSITELCGEEE